MSKYEGLSYGERQQMRQLLGTKCRICGADNAEYHHIIPISMGGTNDTSNIIPLCQHHHKIVHGVRDRQRFATGEPRGGRPRTVDALPYNYKVILGAYLECQIGRNECKHRLGMGRATKLTDAVWFREYLQEHHIIEFKNNVDVAAKNGNLYPGRQCGYIMYDGEEAPRPQYWYGYVLNIEEAK